jgi:hypothetical protein
MRVYLLALALVLAFAATACGKSSKQKRQEFITHANAICIHFSTLQNEVRFPESNPLARGTTHRERAMWGLALNQVINYGRQQIRGLRRLKPPKDLHDRFEEMLALKTAAFDYLAKGADAAKRNHRTKIKPPVDAGRKKLAQVSTLARKIGLPKCA